MYDNLDQDEHATQEVEVTSKRRRAVALVGAGLLLLGVGAVSVKTSRLSKQTASLRAASKAPAVKSFSKPGDYARDVSTCTSAERGPVLAAALLFTDEYARYIASFPDKKITILVTDFLDDGSD